MKDYRSSHKVDYEEPDKVSWTQIEPLQFLHGHKWGQAALNYIHALRPSSIRVTDGAMKMDSRPWRVTVLVNDQDIIEEITQEVEVGCVGYENAYEMDIINR